MVPLSLGALEHVPLSVGPLCSFFKKAALVISKLQLIGAEPESLTVNPLVFFFFFLALTLRRKEKQNRLCFQGLKKQIEPAREMTLGHRIRVPWSAGNRCPALI